MERRQGPPLRSRTKPRSRAWPWIVVVVICLLGFVLIFRMLLDRTAWSAGPAVTSNDPVGSAGRPLAEVGHMIAAEAAAASGDQAAARQHVEAAQKDLLREMKMPDPNRRIDPESARAAVRGLPGVRSAAWTDHENLLVMVDGAVYRSDAMIDAVCRQLDPLGDTLAVVVHVENVAARNADELQTVNRNCQLAPGDRAFLQSRRSLDVVPEAVRQQHQAFEQQVKAKSTPKQDQAAIDALMKRTPAM
ncbi:hypothetical protein [Solilutibacter silvestris]|uniref:Uncharacterized protein n=1 Tax=Solilutibacter silvestris TaxID=1645665 RepID=A0A2K1Q463_9GAMM|nr:hypothetical protein [Lysobacter silvestris]PNS09791.1 hypothetical protein Lysil_1420 [Lysobacter silvestris]